MTSATASSAAALTPERLKQFFEPKTIALIGASDKSMWSIMVNGSLRACGFPGTIHYVNPRSETVYGQPTVPSLAAIGAPVDLAFIMVNTGLVLPILQEMAAAGVKNAVILASGFAEAGAQGGALQEQVVQLAHEHDLALLGPNCLGYLNYGHHVGAMPGVPAKQAAARRGWHRLAERRQRQPDDHLRDPPGDWPERDDQLRQRGGAVGQRRDRVSDRRREHPGDRGLYGEHSAASGLCAGGAARLARSASRSSRSRPTAARPASAWPRRTPAR